MLKENIKRVQFNAVFVQYIFSKNYIFQIISLSKIF